MGSREVRDPVHGLIELSTEEWQVVDSPAFQRLRGIHQLALTYLVYPGARHSRFEHCVGVAATAGRIAEQVGLEPVQQRAVRFAALLHDIGHGPFSHVSEELFEELGDEREEEAAIHEQVSAAIVMHHQPVRDVLGGELAEWIAHLLKAEEHARKRTLERDIVAGPADVDKLDYLLRDSYFCGVNYGNYDLPKLKDSARKHAAGPESYLAFDVSAVYALEEMLLARHHMHRQVYGHKTRVATDLMLKRAMRAGVEADALPRDVFVPTGEMDERFVEEYIRWDDRKVLDRLLDADGTAGRTTRKLVWRDLVARVAELSYEDFNRASPGTLYAHYVTDPEWWDSDRRHAVEEDFARLLGCAAEDVYLHVREFKNPLLIEPRGQVAAKDIVLTDDEKGTVTKFHDHSEIFDAGATQRYAKIDVYAPRAACADHSDVYETAVRVIVDHAREDGAG